MQVRKLLLVVTLIFGVVETVDIPDTGLAAAVFAILFFVCAAWLWRRGSVIAAIILAFMFLVEVTQAHTWKNTSTALQVFAMALGTVGLLAVVGEGALRLRAWRIGHARLQ